MSQSVQEPPANQFPPADSYTQQQTPAKVPFDMSALAEDDDFQVPSYLANSRATTPALNKAVSEVLKEMEFVKKRGHNKFFNYDYATADDLREHVAVLLGKHGLSYEQHEVKIRPLGSLIAVTYLFIVCHESGEIGPFERRTVFARALSEKGGTLDDKAISKTCVLALKDWSKTRFSIPTGEDQEPAGGNDPDSDQYTDVKPNQRTQAPPKGQGSTTNLRDTVRTIQGGKPAQDGDAARKLQEQLNASKAREAGDSAEAEAKKWVDNLVTRVRLELSAAAPENARDAVASAFSKPNTQSFISKLQADGGALRKVYDGLVQDLQHPDVLKHAGGLSSVFPQLHADIVASNKNGQAG